MAKRPRADRSGPFVFTRGPLKARNTSLELDLGAGLLEGRLDLLGFFLGKAFLDGLRRAFDEVLGLFQAEGGDGAHFLDDFDLLVAGRGENDRELGLFLYRSRRAGAASAWGRSDRHSGGGRNAPFFLEEL